MRNLFPGLKQAINKTIDFLTGGLKIVEDGVEATKSEVRLKLGFAASHPWVKVVEATRNEVYIGLRLWTETSLKIARLTLYLGWALAVWVVQSITVPNLHEGRSMFSNLMHTLHHPPPSFAMPGFRGAYTLSRATFWGLDSSARRWLTSYHCLWGRPIKKRPIDTSKAVPLDEWLGVQLKRPAPLFWFAGLAALAFFLGGDEAICLMAAIPPRRIVGRINEERKRVGLAVDYRMHPCITVLGEAHGSAKGQSLLGAVFNRRKEKAPKVIVEAGGRWNAFVLKALPKLNERRRALGLEEYVVRHDDIIFTEFRNGSNPDAVIRMMSSAGYASANPGVFLRLRNKEGDVLPWTKYLLNEVVESGMDLRSYGRSWTTSPMKYWIDAPVFFVDFTRLGLKTDGWSAFTQGLKAINSIAVQARFITAPKDMREQGLPSFVAKGLFTAGKILHNHTAGKAEFIPRAQWRQMEQDAAVVEAVRNCTPFEWNGITYQSGVFINTSNMVKGPAKKCAKEWDGKQLHPDSYLGYVIAEQAPTKTSLGWQTLQLIHKLLVAEDRALLEEHLDEKISKLLDTKLDAELVQELDRRGTTETDLKAIKILQGLSGKAVSRLAFGAGLSGQTDYVTEWEAIPQGWAIHNTPRKVRKDLENDEAAEMGMSRYPQQGFESLLHLKVLSATQIGTLYGLLKMGKEDEVTGDLDLFWRLMQQKAGGRDKALLALQSICGLLPFIKAGCCFLSHEDQFSRLRGDSDGDKNFWSYAPVFVSLFRRVSEASKCLPIPRLEIDGDGESLSKDFEANYFELITSEKVSNGRKLALYGLICAANNGQGPVGLIANLSTICLSRLEWEIVDGKIHWITPGAAEFFAYLLLLQQTAIDRQKRVYPEPSLLRWRLARLFPSAGDEAPALTPPSRDNDPKAHYQRLRKSEGVWSLSPTSSQWVEAYKPGEMYNPAVLFHWGAWTLNELLLRREFTAAEQQMLSEALVKGREAFNEALVGMGLSQEQAEGFVLPDELVSWKKEANLQEVKGVPAPGLKLAWEMAVETYKKVLNNMGVTDPREHLARGNDATVVKHGVEINFTYFDPNTDKSRRNRGHLFISHKDIPVLRRAWARITDNDSTEVAESERLQGDTVNSPSDMKRFLRECLSTEEWDAHTSSSYYRSGSKGGKIPLDVVINKVLGGKDSAWNPERRKAVALAILTCLKAVGGAEYRIARRKNRNSAAKAMSRIVEQGFFDGKEWNTAPPEEGPEFTAWEKNYSPLERWINKAQNLLTRHRKLAAAFKRWGVPTIEMRDRYLLVKGQGFPENGANARLLKSFLDDLSKDENSQGDANGDFTFQVLYPVFELAWQLAEELSERDGLGNSPALTLDEVKSLTAGGASTAVQVGSINQVAANLTRDKVLKLLEDRLSLKALLLFALDQLSWVGRRRERLEVKELLLDSTGNETDLQALRNLRQYVEDATGRPEQHAGRVSEILQLLSSPAFWRKVQSANRPLLGLVRLRDWWSGWADLFNVKASRRTSWTNSKVQEGFLKINVKVVNEEIVETGRWIRSRILFNMPSRWVAGFLGSAFVKGGLADCYLLTQEGNGRFSRGRWTYLHGGILKLAAKATQKALPDLKVSAHRHLVNVLMVWLAPTTPLYGGCLTHKDQLKRELKWLGGRKDVTIPGVKNPSAEAVKTFLFNLYGYLQPLKFKWTSKERQTGSAIVYAPVTFNAGNKLASVSDRAAWHLSSKLWAVLYSLGVVSPNDDWEAASAKFKAFWGFKYPTRKDGGFGAIGEAVQPNTKKRLPWLTKARDEDIARLQRATVECGFATGDDAEWQEVGAGPNGFPPIQQLVLRVLEVVLNPKEGDTQIKGSLQKAILALLGLSSWEYQLETLRGEPTIYTRWVARSFNRITASSLRDLFGALHEGSGWSIADAKYSASGGLPPRQEGRVESTVEERWLDLLQMMWPRAGFVDTEELIDWAKAQTQNSTASQQPEGTEGFYLS